MTSLGSGLIRLVLRLLSKVKTRKTDLHLRPFPKKGLIGNSIVHDGSWEDKAFTHTLGKGSGRRTSSEEQGPRAMASKALELRWRPEARVLATVASG